MDERCGEQYGCAWRGLRQRARTHDDGGREAGIAVEDFGQLVGESKPQRNLHDRREYAGGDARKDSGTPLHELDHAGSVHRHRARQVDQHRSTSLPAAAIPFMLRRRRQCLTL